MPSQDVKRGVDRLQFLFGYLPQPGFIGILVGMKFCYDSKARGRDIIEACCFRQPKDRKTLGERKIASLTRQ